MSDRNCKLFVGGLNVDTRDDELRKHFEHFGKLTDWVVIQNKNVNRSRCFGFVTYSTCEEVEAALAAMPHVVDGSAVTLKRAVSRREVRRLLALGKVKKIFVGGLKGIEEEQLVEYFAQFGEIEKVNLLCEGKKQGFGFIYFADHDSAEKATAMTFHTVQGHTVEVKKALTKQELAVKKALTKQAMQAASKVGMMNVMVCSYKKGSLLFI
ncbi:heterogeneous nuclear ribonucleoprotein A0-like [Diretmus argenteus]